MRFCGGFGLLEKLARTENRPETDAVARQGVSVWLRAEFDVLLRRVRRRPNRPLLQTADPEATLHALMDRRYPVYAQADVTVLSRDAAHEAIVDDVVAALAAFLDVKRPDVGRPEPLRGERAATEEKP